MLRVFVWQNLPQRQLRTLIHRFATKEAAKLKQGSSEFYVWRVRRLKAVAVFEKRFGGVPAIFKMRKMTVLKSYYINNGVYLWPTSTLITKNNKDTYQE
ncbi:hypothetical protein GM320_13745 [Shewanella algae]|nr:hypothetical protein GM320_13745 [Shewanella algae]